MPEHESCERWKWKMEVYLLEISGIWLYDSNKVVDQILKNNCNNVGQARLWYNRQTKDYFTDAIIKVPKTSEDKEGQVLIGGTDAGNAQAPRWVGFILLNALNSRIKRWRITNFIFISVYASAGNLIRSVFETSAASMNFAMLSTHVESAAHLWVWLLYHS